jgi:hypothetical protein
MSRKPKTPPPANANLPPDIRFQDELEVFSSEVESAGQFLYTYLTIHAVLGENDAVYKTINSARLFWATNLSTLQTSAFVAIGRIFDQSSTHNVDRLLGIAQNNLGIFGKAELAKRKQGPSKTAPAWFAEYLHQAYVPTDADFKDLRSQVAALRKIYEASYRDLRHRIFAHKEVADPTHVSALFAKTNVQELERLIVSLQGVHDALWQLFHNGRKPDAKVGRHSVNEMLQEQLPAGASLYERVVHEVRDFLSKISGIPN